MHMFSPEEMQENILKVKESIREAASEANRDPSEITLIGVSKFFPAEYAAQAFSLGLKDLGENRPEEMHEKKEILDQQGIHPNWHLIGTIQSRKVRLIAGDPYLIHSVDTLSLAKEISKRYAAKDITAKILLEVNVSGEESKHGFTSDEVREQFEEILNLPNMKVCGLMTMAPIQSREGEAREVFEKTRVLFDHLKANCADPEDWKYMSMGMSQDYRDAIVCGATHIRIGTAIFGKRDYPDPV
ncbi:MAG: YggS family pyridoxal phosphate-dependent enzyme [Clostridiales bacterium]|nr:YggS family pyridoxal phosphate-dependent enzyme [Clostridiales bacterium]